MKPPVQSVAVSRFRLERIYAMNETVFGAQITKKFGGPILAPRLPSEHTLPAIHLAEERPEIPKVFPRGQERLRALKHDHVRVENGGDLASALPGQPHLLRRAEAAIKLSLHGTHFRLQAPICRARRSVRDELPSLHAEPELRRS